MRDLCATFEKHDAEAFRPFFTDDVVYHNIPLEPAVGIDAAIAFVESFFAMCESMVIETTHLAVRGNVVLTERVDTFTIGEQSAPLPVMGTFEVRDGKICAWRDYFDMAQITNMVSGRRLTTPAEPVAGRSCRLATDRRSAFKPLSAARRRRRCRWRAVVGRRGIPGRSRSGGTQDLQLLGRLDPLGHHLQAEGVGQVDDGRDDLLPLGIAPRAPPRRTDRP